MLLCFFSPCTIFLLVFFVGGGHLKLPPKGRQQIYGLINIYNELLKKQTQVDRNYSFKLTIN